MVKYRQEETITTEPLSQGLGVLPGQAGCSSSPPLPASPSIWLSSIECIYAIVGASQQPISSTSSTSQLNCIQ